MIDRAAAMHPHLRHELAVAEDLIAYGCIQHTVGPHYIIVTDQYLDTAHADLDTMTCTCPAFYYGTAPRVSTYTLCCHLLAALLLDTASRDVRPVEDESRQQDEPLPAA